MTAPFNHEDLLKLKGFIEFVTQNPTILNMPQLDFVKCFIEKFGGTVPAGDFKMPSGGKCPFGGDAGGMKGESTAADTNSDDSDVAIEIETESEAESDVELDMEGVIEGDQIANQPMGDSTKTPTEEEIDQAGELRSKAAAAYSQQKFDEAIEFYTKAIEMNPGNALFHAKRGQAFLKLKKPNACILDCDKALELNCDSAAAYKFRGRAHRLLGNWESAAKDLRQACKLDFDEEADEWLREVQPNAKKIEQHRIKKERKEADHKRKSQEKARRTRDAKEHTKSDAGGMPRGFGSFPFPGEMPSGLTIGDLMSKMKDPEVAAAMQDIVSNPANIAKYASNPKVSELLKTLFPNNVPGAAGAAAESGAPDNTEGSETAKENTANLNDTNTTNEAASKPKSESVKPDFVDDGLD